MIQMAIGEKKVFICQRRSVNWLVNIDGKNRAWFPEKERALEYVDLLIEKEGKAND